MAPGAPAWEITAQREDWQLDPTTGQVAHGMLVTFRTAGNATGTVFVPAERYTVEAVRTAVADKARTIDAIASLKG